MSFFVPFLVVSVLLCVTWWIIPSIYRGGFHSGRNSQLPENVQPQLEAIQPVVTVAEPPSSSLNVVVVQH